MLIGLIGVKGSGKDAVADIIQRHLKSNRLAFADKIKEVCAKEFKLDKSFFHDQVLKEAELKNPEALGYVRCLEIMDSFDINSSLLTIDQINYIGVLSQIILKTPRQIMQVVGTELLRYFDNDVHVKTIKLDKLAGTNIVTDVRMPNELRHLNGYSGEVKLLYIQRDSAEAKVNENSHESEKNVFIIRDKCVKTDNNGTLEELEETVVSLLNLKDNYLEDVV
jgi:hypothetical protein